jgi:hypothetical protein
MRSSGWKSLGHSILARRVTAGRPADSLGVNGLTIRRRLGFAAADLRHRGLRLRDVRYSPIDVSVISSHPQLKAVLWRAELPVHMWVLLPSAETLSVARGNELEFGGNRFITLRIPRNGDNHEYSPNQPARGHLGRHLTQRQTPLQISNVHCCLVDRVANRMSREGTRTGQEVTDIDRGVAGNEGKIVS